MRATILGLAATLPLSICFTVYWSKAHAHLDVQRQPTGALPDLLAVEVMVLTKQVRDLERDNQAILDTLGENSPVHMKIIKAIKDSKAKGEAEDEKLRLRLYGLTK